jgi:hypothetical protein
MKYYRSHSSPNCIWIVDYDKMQYCAYFSHIQRYLRVEGFTSKTLFDADIPMEDKEVFLEML